jgi:malate synthase
MSPNFEASTAFHAALDLVLRGRDQPNGYTEALLWHHRRAFKAKRG